MQAGAATTDDVTFPLTLICIEKSGKIDQMFDPVVSSVSILIFFIHPNEALARDAFRQSL